LTQESRYAFARRSSSGDLGERLHDEHGVGPETCGVTSERSSSMRPAYTASGSGPALEASLEVLGAEAFDAARDQVLRVR